MIDEQERKRSEIIQRREDRIKGLMNMMAEGVVKKQKEEEMEMERILLKGQEEKEEKDRKDEIARREKARQDNIKNNM